MKSRINTHYPTSNFSSFSNRNLYVADFSRRTNKARGVEVHVDIPVCPINPDSKMDCLEILNPNEANVDFNLFDDEQFKNEQGQCIEHCEGCFFPTKNDVKSWVVMFEIKDCDPKNIKNYITKARHQIIAVTEIFRAKKIITKNTVYGVISMPQYVEFDNTVLGMPSDFMAWRQEHKIIFRGTNKFTIE